MYILPVVLLMQLQAGGPAQGGGEGEQQSTSRR